MFASVRRYRLESGSIDDLLHLVDTDFAEAVQEMEGFLEYQVLECGNGEIITITTFRDRRSAEASMEVSADWVRDTLAAQFELTRLEGFVGEVAISRAREDVTVPARY
jgi:heme-degrading monooxygenase HmoA